MFSVHSVIVLKSTMTKRKHFKPMYNLCDLFSYSKYLNQYFQLQAKSVACSWKYWFKYLLKEVMCVSHFQISWGDGELCWLKFTSSHLRTCSLRWYRLWALCVMILGEFQVPKISHHLKQCLSHLCCWPWCLSGAKLTMVLRNKKGIRYIVIIYFKTILFYFWCMK